MSRIVYGARRELSRATDESSRAELANRFEADSPVTERLMNLFDYYEELGAAYCRGLLDDDLVRELLAHAAVQDYDRAAWLLERHRRASGNPVAINWQRFADHWRSRI
jgi:hypothetical protein